ncbi:undecaprenyldiphospho-muramoylpentapeptide beta-N-acetylglucosaminyltransferase [Paenibacillus flagellatus]|uniref:UDP-N-acetylglucosamine--N-acetylmuramyl-(pentapeptide) pyrophosphoryl-undecaprenol N-acetylglucosamine transferase n=1 Tax=Paenibacillus flagellatus TaxID=2211139 RepID=A0A2V5K5C3_9BACL|nr:undecaprenyldiphospho-muramoylpentapeptide beta-N-acetylglucosaminyltransferase [Paenibacillus flagellatus]PYI54575.1 undecaprenyldiphospho-muramoylpentapeptide beta-N-acetylglucosaminyltransferase [Paenibacillus flagellatus]
MKSIVFTGGGSAGHVTPNLALIARLKERGWTVDYIGSADGIEKSIIGETGIPFHAISSGKLRRYFDLKNFKDPFKVLKGVYDAYRIIRKLKPDAVFSKGGFVSVPVVVAAWMNRIPVLIHESDMTPGLANKLSIPFATKVCVTFPETIRHLAGGKAEWTGLPIRDEVLRGNALKGLAVCDFHRQKPILFVMGGSLGSRAINEALRGGLDRLLEKFQIAHICGKGNLDPAFDGKRGYRQFEYVTGGLPDLLAMADVVVSRSGSTSIFEFLSLRKPMLLVPLSRNASRGDQILNAESFRSQGYGEVLEEERMTAGTLAEAVFRLYDERDRYVERMKSHSNQDSIARIVGLIERSARR